MGTSEFLSRSCMMYLFVLTSFLGSAGVFMPYVMQLILRFLGGEGKSERQVRQEISKLKLQLQALSMVDQFAAYAKLQRKINTLQQQYKDRVSQRVAGEQKVRMVLGGCVRSVIGLMCVWLVWEYRSDSVASLPPTLMWPLGPLLALPSCQLGQVSVVVWLGVVRSVCQRLAAYISPAAKVSATNASRPTIPSSFFNPPSTTIATPVAPPLD